VGNKSRHDLRTEYVKGISVLQSIEHTRTLRIGERDTWQTKEDLAGVCDKEIVRMKLFRIVSIIAFGLRYQRLGPRYRQINTKSYANNYHSL
jgi:hypothetical protein